MSLSIFLTNACDRQCRYCFNLDRVSAPRAPLAAVRSVLAAAHARGSRYVTITGGEPFLYEDLFAVLDFAHGLGYWVNILTHGGLITEDYIARLKQYWRLRLRVSLDGPDRASNDYLRGEGSFDATWAAVGALLESGLNIGLGVMVTAHNLDAVGDLLALALDREIAFVRCIPVARIRKGRTADVDASLHERLLETLVRFAVEHRKRIEAPPPARLRTPASLESITTRRCMAGKTYFGVTADLKIVPCPIISDHPEVPHVLFEEGESFARLGVKMDALFAAMEGRLEGPCAGCDFREVCRGGCLAEKISFERPLNGAQPACPRLMLERIARRFDAADFDWVLRCWAARLASSLEESRHYGCMRQAPYWTVNFRPKAESREWKAERMGSTSP